MKSRMLGKEQCGLVHAYLGPTHRALSSVTRSDDGSRAHPMGENTVRKALDLTCSCSSHWVCWERTHEHILIHARTYSQAHTHTESQTCTHTALHFTGGTWRPSEGKRLAQGHTADQGPSWDQTSPLVPRPRMKRGQIEKHRRSLSRLRGSVRSSPTVCRGWHAPVPPHHLWVLARPQPPVS